ncbi:MAG: replication-associated recombination protein A [Phycisphaerae bacterium]|nr:replication-associated recombination protein A [Phycisphaerae bacterium]
MDLFKQLEVSAVAAHAPLAVRMRPRTLEEFCGQEAFLGEGRMLRRMIQAGRLTSVVFFGPPGSGKTTLANVIARHFDCEFHQVNAASASVKEVREIIDGARALLASSGRRTVLFIDELHRFNRAQQDVLLNDVEIGTIILIAATTENPFFSINSPLLSRSTVFEFTALLEADVVALLRRALSDHERGLGRFDVRATDEALLHLATVCDGDARRALTALEVGVLSQAARAAAGGEGVVFDLPIAQESIQQKALQYDQAGEGHYDTISAFIKSMRGSDPDATVYWLAKMLVAGEDPMFIARRIAILASEDIGNADPRAISVAAAAYEIVHRIGMPEGQLTLAQAAIYMACAPKSNRSAAAIWEATADVKNNRTAAVPKHLRNAPHSGMKSLGYGVGYQYSHEFAGGVSPDQDYLGVDRQYYQPTDRGYEKHIKEYLDWAAKMREDGKQGGAKPE